MARHIVGGSDKHQSNSGVHDRSDDPAMINLGGRLWLRMWLIKEDARSVATELIKI